MYYVGRVLPIITVIESDAIQDITIHRIACSYWTQFIFHFIFKSNKYFNRYNLFILGPVRKNCYLLYTLTYKVTIFYSCWLRSNNFTHSNWFVKSTFLTPVVKIYFHRFAFFSATSRGMQLRNIRSTLIPGLIFFYITYFSLLQETKK